MNNEFHVAVALTPNHKIKLSKQDDKDKIIPTNFHINLHIDNLSMISCW